MIVAQGDLITAADYNTLANELNEYWADNYESNTPASNSAENAKGWGQPKVNDKVIGDIITARSINEMANRANLAVTQTGAGTPVDKVTAGESIMTSSFNLISANSADILANSNVVVDSTTTSNGSDGSISRSSWTNEIRVVVTASFSSFKEARYFFNSGGQLRYSFANTGSTNDALAWQDLFDGTDMGTLIFSGIEDIVQTGTRNGHVIAGSGFYSLNTVPKELYYINLDMSPYTDNDLSLMGSINAAGDTISLEFILKNDDTNAETVNGNTTVYLDSRKADSKSATDPSVSFSITGPTHSVAAWTGS